MTDTAQRFPLAWFAALMRQTPAQPATNLWRAVELTALMEKALPLLAQAQTVLDLGCGDGAIMGLLRPRLSSKTALIGIDPDSWETELAKKRGIYAQVLTCGGQAVPLAAQSVDAVVSNSVLEHIPDLDAVLRESARLLRPQGVLIATVPGPDFHACLRGPLWPGADASRYAQEIDRRLAHCRYWSVGEWETHLAQAGLALERTQAYLPMAVVRRWEWLSRLTGGLLYRLAGRTKPPIRLQRELGLRKDLTLPAGLAFALAWLLSRGLSAPAARASVPAAARAAQEGQEGIGSEGLFGGLLVIGRKL